MTTNTNKLEKQMQNENKPLSGAQRLEGLEATAKALDMAVFQLTQQLSTTETAHRELSDQLKALITLLESGSPINETLVGQKRVDTKIEAMKASIADKVGLGVLAPTDTVAEDSFLVGSEYVTATGVTQNARIQVAMFAIKSEELRNSLLGKMVGDNVVVSDTVSLSIQEVYKIKTDQPAPTPEASPEASEPVQDSQEDSAPEQVAASS